MAAITHRGPRNPLLGCVVPQRGGILQIAQGLGGFLGRSNVRAHLIAALLSLLLATSAKAQYPTDMVFCFSSELELCADVVAGDLLDPFCPIGPRAWKSFFGRVAFEILQYAGPITIEVDAQRSIFSRFPIYIEWIPVEGRPQELGFCDGPGHVIAVVWGGSQCDSPFETFGPIWLPLEVGDRYVIRAHWVGEPGHRHQTYLNCIRVSSPTETTPIESTTWGMVKRLYR